ncbi:alpha/beta hydrolase [Derxia gummosa]|uniref:Alpha/beta hydrolase n=1 Tax=Derxia gummosa DSM 723 TaxID=1121388 RepID=A0A8B6X9S8_9BURK|nr:alpha/beta hydrolase [Derxia gummosa]
MNRHVFHADLGATGHLDPQVAEVLRMVERARHTPYDELGAVKARAAYERSARILDIAPLPVHAVETLALTRRDGGEIGVRLYWPGEPDWTAPLPLLVFLHGGGFTVGSAATHDRIVRRLCTGAGCAVASVEYRLAPEHPFPAAFEDAWDALAHFAAEAGRYGIDPARIAIGGDSAGGTLSAACAIAARDAGLPLALQLLIYPGTDSHQDTESHLRLADGFLLTRKTILWFFGHYLTGESARTDWRFAPLCAPSLGGVAPAWVCVAEFDPLVDEGVAYARRLQAAGVPTELRFYAGMVHNFFAMGGYVAAAKLAHEHAVAALKQAFEGEG